MNKLALLFFSIALYSPMIASAQENKLTEQSIEKIFENRAGGTCNGQLADPYCECKRIAADWCEGHSGLPLGPLGRPICLPPPLPHNIPPYNPHGIYNPHDWDLSDPDYRYCMEIVRDISKTRYKREIACTAVLSALCDIDPNFRPEQYSNS